MESYVIKAIVTDIEGTTSSISFVHEVLFPYAAAHLREFVIKNFQQPEVCAQLEEVARLSGCDAGDVEALILQLQTWIAEDKKITPLKALQGMIWKSGYENGDYVGHIYDDAYQSLTAWHRQGVPLYVYSSGSIAAQRLLFGHTAHGDLNPLFTGNFDTLTGGKKEVASYLKIADAIGQDPASVLFLSDIVDELDAAKSAGMKTCWLLRDGAVSGAVKHPVVTAFSQINLAAF
ncbi:MAG: acireductone synthase [Hahellaceae bacterium]|nr:acireductone synthase [Hahellaceae bacterium]MCP5213161.1 acireductone synthase [Hahellaceae bacterium]